MPICLHAAPLMSGTATVKDTTTGVQAVVYIADNPQPTDFSTCSFVIQSGAEVTLSPFALTTEQGAQIGAAILGLWAVAWVLRQVAGLLNSSTQSTDKES